MAVMDLAPANTSNIVVFPTPSGDISIAVDPERDTVWATAQQVAEMFGVDRTSIVKHAQSIYADGELDASATCEVSSQVRTEGDREVTRVVRRYNLDLILAVGYRVNSRTASEFRRWATSALRSYIQDGFVVNLDALAKSEPAQRALAKQLRAIRLSEQSLYAKVRAVFKMSASDYEAGSPAAQSFFAMAQDKFHYAVTGKTAAQLILERASSTKPNLGMTHSTHVALTDLKVAKNYLTDDELQGLENISEQFLLFTESKAFRGQTMTMEELQFKLNTLLTANDYQVLYQYPAYQRGQADKHVETELAAYRKGITQTASG